MARILWFLAVLVLLVGCAKSYAPAYYDEPEAEMQYFAEAPVSGDMATESDAISVTPTPTTRMVYYNGHVELRVTKVEESLDALKGLAEDVGGYVESLSSQHITLRVPVATFDEAVTSAMGLGDVLSRSVTAQDVTEAFTAIDLRLQTARASRDRLVELLARATDEKEKIALLREIQRLNEEIDVTEGQLRTLSSLASFSRLSVSLVPRAAFADRDVSQDAVGLEWIQELSPFRREVGEYSRRLKVAVPDGLVSLSSSGRFIAESADGAVLWTSRLPNEPRGDADFWVAAIQQRLAPEFSAAEVTQVGEWTMLRLVADGDTPYRYLIGVIDSGSKLQLVEIYYPSPEQEERYGADILTGLRNEQG